MSEEGKRCVGQYEIKETLGKGGYSWVKKGVDTKTGSTVALKFMSRADKSWEREQADQVRTEIKSMVKIESKHVMRLFAYNLNCKYPEKNGNELNTILLVLEFCPGGELFDILYYTQQLEDITARTYFVQLMDGLKACHDAGIVHRDLKPQNLLMDAKYQLKITDFGLSKLTKNAKKAVMKTHYVGTRGYQAPELLKKKKYGKACDIFSAGVVLFILLTGYPPFEQAVKSDKWYNPLTSRDKDKFWEQHKGCGVKKDAKELITRMLAYHPSERIEIDDILKSDFCLGKTHTPEELYKVLRKKHRETSRRRKKDKKKMAEMEHSIMKKRDTDEFQEMLKRLASKPCPKKDYEPRESFLTKRWIVRPNYKGQANSEVEQKEVSNSIPKEVVQAYHVALLALSLNGLTKLSFEDETDPWNVICIATDMEQTKYEIEMKINQDQNGVYYFNFRRVAGDRLKFRKFWLICESWFIHSKHFTDEFVEEIDEQEALAAKLNLDDEKEESKGAEEVESNKLGAIGTY